HVLATRIPPPHSAARIKQYLSRREAVADSTSSDLFADFSCLNPLNDLELVDTLNPVGAGSAPGDPIALVLLSPPDTITSTPTQVTLPQHATISPQPWDGTRPAGYNYTIRALYTSTFGYPYFEHISDILSSSDSFQ